MYELFIDVGSWCLYMNKFLHMAAINLRVVLLPDGFRD